jgi:hypothetical protein
MNPPVNLTKPPPPPWAGATADDLDRYMDDFLADCLVCSRSPFDDACLHVWCEIHRCWTEVNVPRCWTSPGFAGGGISHTEYRCGCTDHDESGDVAAAY